MSARKRKAEDDLPDRDRMSFSPSPAMSHAPMLSPTPRHNTASSTFKRPRTNFVGRSLTLPRLLETLSAEQMRAMLCSISERHVGIEAEIIAEAPRPSVPAALEVLRKYYTAFQNSFPYGNKPTSDYAFNRVMPALKALLEALCDYTPHFLPPNETQVSISLNYLDAVTNIIHELPNWDNFQHNHFKHDAYEEIAKSWASVIREAAKRGGGIQLQVGGWDRKLADHDEASGGRMGEATAELKRNATWGAPMTTGVGEMPEDERQSIREQIMNGTYGVNNAIQVGPW